MLKHLIIAAVSALCLSACSGVSVQTNLNPGNFTDYFKASTVDVVEEGDLEGKTYAVIGPVHGLSCQTDADDFPANETDARTALLRKAADKGANAVQIHKCVKAKDTGVCSLSVTCYGDALYVKDDKQL